MNLKLEVGARNEKSCFWWSANLASDDLTRTDDG